jgi:hypothetical protein
MNVTKLGRGVMTLALLGAASFVIAGVSPECSRVEDKVTRPEILGDPTGGAGQSSSYEQCEKDCKRDADRLRRKENRRHRDALRDCRNGGDDDSSDSGSGHSNGGSSVAQCIADENAMHARNLAEIAALEQACIAACHGQGGGGSQDDDD